MWSTRTVAEFAFRSIEFGARPAQRVKRDGAWHDVSYAEVGAAAVEVALGLVALGVRPGDRVCVLAETRPEWSPIQYGIAAAGGVTVPIYPSSSADECQWVIGRASCRERVAMSVVVARLPNNAEF